MEFSEFFPILLGALVGSAIPLIFWSAVVVFATIMLRRSGGRAERFIIAGAVIHIVANVFRIPMNAITPWFFSRGYEISYVQSITLGSGVFIDVLSAAGIICLIYAFWVKFNMKGFVPTDSVNADKAEQITA